MIALITIQALFETVSGKYAIYTSVSGNKKWTRDYGYSVGDKVELSYDPESKRPNYVKVNGKEIEINKSQ